METPKNETLELPKLNFETPNVERLLILALKKLDSLESRVNDIETTKIIDETKLPPELLNDNNLLPATPKRTYRGKGYRPLLISEIEEAQKNSNTAAGQSRYLGVSYKTYRKYCILYNMHHPNETGDKLGGLYAPEKGKYPLSEILKNKFPDINDFVVKDKLIRSNTLPAKCNQCGFKDRRFIDKKIPLLLDHKDGNGKNFELDNLQLLCLNCTFICGRGYIRSGKQKFDVDWIQGASVKNVDSISRY